MITTVTLNSSIDKAYQMEQALQNGTVMRVAKVRNSAGGKGLNVARAAKLCGSDVQATGFCGGYNGAYLKHLLAEDGIEEHFVEVAAETRSCINLLDPGFGSTEYLEPGAPISEQELDVFLKAFPEIIAKSDVVTLSGSAPSGIPSDIYAKLIHLAKEQGKQVILDTSGAFLIDGIPAAPTMVKPKQDEIEALFHEKIESREQLIGYAEKIFDSGIPYVVISLGGDGALLVCEEGVFQGLPPKISVKNTVGCGDSMVGGFAVAMEHGYTNQDALRYAISVATANALSPNTGDFDPAVREQIYTQVKIRKIEGH